MSQLDIGIVVAYLVITLVIGLWAGRGVTTVKQYAVGSKNYSTMVIVATIFATIFGGGSTIGYSEKIFIMGMAFALLNFVSIPSKLIIAYFIAPHMPRFYNKISVGEVMGSLYGKPGRLVTGVSGAVICVGTIAAQVSALGYVFNYFFELPHAWGAVIGCGIAIAYSSVGGIRAVTLTDVFQFGVLMYVIPMICYETIWKVGGLDQIALAIPAEKMQFAPYWREMIRYLPLYLLDFLHFLDPEGGQRLLMARDGVQASNAMKSVAVLHFLFKLATAIIAFGVFVLAPNLEPSSTFLYMTDTVLSVGWKGISIAGILAIIMSTTDSGLNAGGVSLVHDFVQPLRRKPFDTKTELRLLRLVSVAIGLFALVAALYLRSILDIVLFFFAFWGTCIALPLFIGILGYKSSIRSFLIAFVAGFGTTLLWKLFIAHQVGFGAFFPAVTVNFVTFCIARHFDRPEDIYWDESEFDPSLPDQKRQWRQQWEQKHGKRAKQSQSQHKVEKRNDKPQQKPI